ncbi:hypothetical protein RBSWK_01344 [Rhodopirellula baltica SWK14]|uniref:Uncharacterized protein n=1 Tax=Rhodopirellula baltica SWK14 TaxID=993516 RepID=L7CMH5_RHOBT|nr:hypothetical protein RBSWK_01344 [Rhodopirellula baltica SWK14]
MGGGSRMTGTKMCLVLGRMTSLASLVTGKLRRNELAPLVHGL